MATWVFFATQVSENKRRPKVTVKLGFMMGVQMMMMGSYCWQTSFSPGSLSLEATPVLLKHAAAWTHAHSHTHTHPDRKALKGAVGICGVRSICCFNTALKWRKPPDCLNQSCIVFICNLGLYLIGVTVSGGPSFLMSRSQESTLNQRERSQRGVSRQFLPVCTVGGSGGNRESTQNLCVVMWKWGKWIMNALNF